MSSLTAEQFLRFLRDFNVQISAFAPPADTEEARLQKSLSLLGAHHLYESSALLSAKARASQVVYDVLVAAPGPRQITALAPVLVLRCNQINLAHLRSRLREAGLAHRLGWVAENTLRAANALIEGVSLWISASHKVRKATVVLGRFLENFPPPAGNEDVLDDEITTPRSLQSVKASRDEVAERWGIVTRIKAQDFSNALRQAYESDHGHFAGA